MDPERTDTFTIYDLRTYFPRQPDDMKICPACGNSISISSIPMSKAVEQWLAGALIPSHEFSRLYHCSACNWWAIRESWSDREYSDGFDTLTVGRETKSGEVYERVWKEALNDENLYHRTFHPLPEHVGQCFQGDKAGI